MTGWMGKDINWWENDWMDGKEYKMMGRILGLSLRGCHEQLSVTCNIRDYREEAGGGV